MTSLSDLLSVPAFVRWLREEVPGGKIIAPVILVFAIVAFLVWTGGIIWNGLVAPLANYARGITPAVPLGQTITTLLLLLPFVVVGVWLTIRVNRIVRNLNNVRDLIVAITEGAGTEFPRVDARIDELDARVEALEARPAGLKRIEPEADLLGTKGLGESILQVIRGDNKR